MHSTRTVDYLDEHSLNSTGSGSASASAIHGSSASSSNSADYTMRLLEAQQRMSAQRAQHHQLGQRGSMQLPTPTLPLPPQRPQEFSVDPFRLYAKVFIDI